MIDVKEYTLRNLGEQLILAETHLTDFLQGSGGIPDDIISDSLPISKIQTEKDQEFCVECLSKHALAISGFAKEGTQFFNAMPIFATITTTATNLFESTNEFNRNKAIKFYKTLRKLRKQLIAQHLISENPEKNIKNHISEKHLED